MTNVSPSLIRRLATAPRVSAFNARPFATLPALRQNTGNNSHVNTSSLPDDKHALDKNKDGDRNDVQSEYVGKGIDSAKNSGTGGNATEERDSAGGAAKAKREFPEAPDPTIGMQDERGGRGG